MAEFERLHVGNTEVQEKQSLAFVFAQTATVGLAVTGVLPGMVGLLVTQTTTASGSVVIGAGAGVVGSTVGAGVSEAINPGAVTFDVLTANPVGGLPRNDIIVWDSVTRLFDVWVGTPNATPSDPTIANTQLPLARLRHAASATTIPLAKIDDIRPFTAPACTPIPVRNQAERDALPAGEGSRVDRLDLHYAETYNGSAWLPNVETFRNGDTHALYGSDPATTTPKVRQEFTAIATTGTYGAFILAYPHPFAHGITSLTVTPGDPSGVGLGFVVPLAPVDLTYVSGYAYSAAGAYINSYPVRVNVVAVGW